MYHGAFGICLHFRRQVTEAFDGGTITSDADGLLLRKAERRMAVMASFGRYFSDYRNPPWVEHSVETLVAQRVYGLVLGYEALRLRGMATVIASPSRPSAPHTRAIP